MLCQHCLVVHQPLPLHHQNKLGHENVDLIKAILLHIKQQNNKNLHLGKAD